MTREVVCKNELNEIINNENCSKNKPIDLIECNQSPCDFCQFPNICSGTYI